MPPRLNRRAFLRQAALGGIVISAPFPRALLASSPTAQNASVSEPLGIPSLNWRQQSDWLNVQSFGAKGDNLTDDTLAIQQALNRLSDNDRPGLRRRTSVVYLPAGIYRISQTLTIARSTGAWLVGHGCDTVIRWCGQTDGVMYLSDGVQCARYDGITWDGQNLGSVGVEHSSQSLYETQIRYQHCAFVDLKQHGLLNGRGQEKQPSAEFWFVNCLFSACANGISLLNYNDYDNILDGCVFLNCGIGINSVNGHFAARTCYFCGNTTADVRQLAPSHASSLRLCTSKGSRRFFETGSGAHYPMKIQGCRVERWTSPDGAIVLAQRGPTTIFDCVFNDPPSKKPPVWLTNPKDIQQLLILSNCVSPETSTVLEEGPNSRVANIPQGKRPLGAADSYRRFFATPPPFSEKILDAVRDFGAKADGAHDDTKALQQGVDAVRSLGRNAILYLPTGTYRITRTLDVTGSDYCISGTGYDSIVEWAGEKNSTMIRIHNPDAVTFQHLNLRGPYTVTRIHHTAASARSCIFYDGIYTNGPDWESRDCHGLWCEKLAEGAVVRIGQFVGNIRLTDCGPATILASLHYYSLRLDGAAQPGNGIAGFMFHNDAAHNYALEVLDNQSVLVADFYSESNKRYLLCCGSEGQPSGRVTIGCSKMSPTESQCITIRDYQGRIFVGGGDSYNPSHWGQPLEIVHDGLRPVDFAIAGQGWWAVEPRMKYGPGLRYASLENLLMENRYPEYSEKSLPNVHPPAAEQSLISAFDDFRELAESYMKHFYA